METYKTRVEKAIGNLEVADQALLILSDISNDVDNIIDNKNYKNAVDSENMLIEIENDIIYLNGEI